MDKIVIDIVDDYNDIVEYGEYLNKKEVKKIIDKQWGKNSIDGNYQYLIKALGLEDD